MKKVEAEMIAPEKVNLLIEYLEQFMSEDEITGEIIIDALKCENERTCFIDIILDNGYQNRIDTGISLQQCDVLNEEILVSLANSYGARDDVELTPFFTINSIRHEVHGLNFFYPEKNMRITFNFKSRGLEFDKVISKYQDVLQTIHIKKQLPKFN